GDEPLQIARHDSPDREEAHAGGRDEEVEGGPRSSKAGQGRGADEPAGKTQQGSSGEERGEGKQRTAQKPAKPLARGQAQEEEQVLHAGASPGSCRRPASR